MASSKVGVTDPPDVGSNESPDVAPKSDMVLMSFQRNWKFELTLDGKVAEIFQPGESKQVARWKAEHRDFAAYADMFVVQEVL